MAGDTRQKQEFHPPPICFVLTPVAQQLAGQVAELVHRGDLKDAAQAVVDGCQLRLKIDDDSPKTCHLPLQHYLHWLLESGGMAEAAQILWTPNQFNPAPECSQQVWKFFDEVNFGLIMGAGSMSKSFTMGVRLLLEWLKDPEFTTVKVLGPSEEHLEQNLFSHLVSLYRNATLPMPGDVGELFIGTDRRDQLGAIRGTIIPVGKTKKAGRLQGAKRKPRPAPHPIYGPLSRLFIFLDEIENIPAGVWSDIDNVMSQFQSEEDMWGLKIFGAYNPTNPGDEVCKRAEPPFGWESFDLDKHYRWVSKRGWDVLRLDGERSENVTSGKVIYPGLQTRAGLDRIARSSGGKQGKGYLSMGRGAYPVNGIEMSIIPPGMFQSLRAEAVWLEDPIPVGSCDLALEGGANAVYTLGKFGLATGMKVPPTLEFPKGRVVIFKTPKGAGVPRYILQAEQQFVLPKGDTVAMKDEVIKISKRAGVRPDYLCLDRTGHGQGVADLIKHEWSSAIWAVNYSESASDEKAMVEDTRKCNEEYSRMCCELWFVLRKWSEFGYLLIHPQLDVSAMSSQVTQRRFHSLGGKVKVESKKDYMLRGFASPDEADSLTLLVYAARKGSGFIPSMKLGGGELTGDDSDEWTDGFYASGVRVDPSNRTDWLDDRQEGPEEDNARRAWEQIMSQ